MNRNYDLTRSNGQQTNNILWQLHLSVIVSARLCAAIALILCALWAHFDYPNFLSVPSWKTNLFAWHPVLMICGFFFSQAFAITSWGAFPRKPHRLEKFQHTIWQFAACATMIAGLIDVFKSKNDRKLPNLVTMHSWFGISTVSMFLLNFVLGLTNLLSRNLNATSGDTVITRLSFNDVLFYFHRVVGQASLLLTVVSIGSGIMNYQGQVGCFYLGIFNLNTPDYNPAANYKSMPAGCKISNGIGVAVISSAICVQAAISLRYLSAIFSTDSLLSGAAAGMSPGGDADGQQSALSAAAHISEHLVKTPTSSALGDSSPMQPLLFPGSPYSPHTPTGGTAYTAEGKEIVLKDETGQQGASMSVSTSTSGIGIGTGTGTMSIGTTATTNTFFTSAAASVGLLLREVTSPAPPKVREQMGKTEAAAPAGVAVAVAGGGAARAGAVGAVGAGGAGGVIEIEGKSTRSRSGSRSNLVEQQLLLHPHPHQQQQQQQLQDAGLKRMLLSEHGGSSGSGSGSSGVVEVIGAAGTAAAARQSLLRSSKGRRTIRDDDKVIKEQEEEDNEEEEKDSFDMDEEKYGQRNPYKKQRQQQPQQPQLPSDKNRGHSESDRDRDIAPPPPPPSTVGFVTPPPMQKRTSPPPPRPPYGGHAMAAAGGDSFVDASLLVTEAVATDTDMDTPTASLSLMSPPASKVGVGAAVTSGLGIGGIGGASHIDILEWEASSSEEGRDDGRKYSSGTMTTPAAVPVTESTYAAAVTVTGYDTEALPAVASTGGALMNDALAAATDPFSAGGGGSSAAMRMNRLHRGEWRIQTTNNNKNSKNNNNKDHAAATATAGGGVDTRNDVGCSYQEEEQLQQLAVAEGEVQQKLLEEKARQLTELLIESSAFPSAPAATSTAATATAAGGGNSWIHAAGDNDEATGGTGTTPPKSLMKNIWKRITGVRKGSLASLPRQNNQPSSLTQGSGTTTPSQTLSTAILRGSSPLQQKAAMKKRLRNFPTMRLLQQSSSPSSSLKKEEERPVTDAGIGAGSAVVKGNYDWSLSTTKRGEEGEEGKEEDKVEEEEEGGGDSSSSPVLKPQELFPHYFSWR